MNPTNRKFPGTLSLVVLAGCILACSQAAIADTEDDQEGTAITWPSNRYPDLQSAVDSARDGAVIQISAGVFSIDHPVFVRGKRLTLAGAGSGQNRGREISQLVGPPPQQVVDDRGTLILNTDSVNGLLNLIGADVVVRDMALSGFDAGIVTRDENERSAAGAPVGRKGHTVVQGVAIANTGRGILALSSSRLQVTDSSISNTRWNAISVAHDGGTPGPGSISATLKSVVIDSALGAGIFFHNVPIVIESTTVIGATAGGIVGRISYSLLTGNSLFDNGVAGILLIGGFSKISQNFIVGTIPDVFNKFGDGVVLKDIPGLQSITATLTENEIAYSGRASVSLFATAATGSAIMKGNKMTCSSFDMDYEAQPYSSAQPHFTDGGGNLCGCPNAGTKACSAVSSALSAPDPVDGP